MRRWQPLTQSSLQLMQRLQGVTVGASPPDPVSVRPNRHQYPPGQTISKRSLHRRMHPQTNAELTAYNEGVRIARTPSARLPHYIDNDNLTVISISGDAQRALDTLGPDLFWLWADRGYSTHRST